MKTISKFFVQTILILFLAIGSAYSSFAQDRTETTTTREENNNVKFVATDGDLMVFDVQFNEVPAKGCVLTITDDAGNELFVEWITRDTYSRRYKIARNGAARIEFTASSKGFFFRQAFQIKTEEKLLVTKEKANP